MVKPKALGTVIKVHDSGNVETNKGFVVQGKFEIGAILLLDEKRNVTVQEKKTNSKKAKTSDESQNEEDDNNPAGNLGLDETEGDDNV